MVNKHIKIISCQGNTNQKHNEIPLYSYQNGYNFLKNVDNYVEKWASLCVALGNVKSCSHCKKKLVLPQKKLNMELLYNRIPKIQLKAVYLRELKIGAQRDTCMFGVYLEHYSEQPKSGNYPSVHQKING